MENNNNNNSQNVYYLNVKQSPTKSPNLNSKLIKNIIKDKPTVKDISLPCNNSMTDDEFKLLFDAIDNL